MDLSKQKVAVFGLGDSLSYGDYFCDAMEEVHPSPPPAPARLPARPREKLPTASHKAD